MSHLKRSFVLLLLVGLLSTSCGDSRKSEQGGTANQDSESILEDFPFPDKDITLKQQGVAVSFPRGSSGDALSPSLKVASIPSLALPAGVTALSPEFQLDSGGPAFATASQSKPPLLEIELPESIGDLRTQNGIVLLTRAPDGVPHLHGNGQLANQWITLLSEITPDTRKLRFSLPALPRKSHYIAARVPQAQRRQNRSASRELPAQSARTEDQIARLRESAADELPPEVPEATSLDLPWAMICDTSDPTLTRATCESEAYRAKAVALANMARTVSTATIRSPEMVYEYARLSTATFETLERAGLPYILSRA